MRREAVAWERAAEVDTRPREAGGGSAPSTKPRTGRIREALSAIRA